MAILSRTGFLAEFADYFGQVRSDISGASRLSEDLGFHMLLLVELAIFLDHLAPGIDLDEKHLASLTLDELFREYAIYAATAHLPRTLY